MSTDASIRDFYFVFGTKYAEELHPVFSTPALPGHYVTVEAPDEDTARRIMLGICGTQWSRCLTQIPAGSFRHGELARYRWGGAASKPEPVPGRQDYGHSVIIGQHEVTSWPAQVEDAVLINDAAVQVAFRGLEVMVYSSTVDGRTIVEVTPGDGQFRIVTDDGDPVYANYPAAGD